MNDLEEKLMLPHPGIRFLRVGAVLDRVGLSRRTFLDLVKAGEFPPPVRPTRGTVAWLEPEVEEWMERKIAERDRRA